LSVRLVQSALKGQWRSEEVAKALQGLPGPTVELTQTVDIKGMPVEVNTASTTR
jgi:hypothetical protein